MLLKSTVPLQGWCDSIRALGHCQLGMPKEFHGQSKWCLGPGHSIVEGRTPPPPPPLAVGQQVACRPYFVCSNGVAITTGRAICPLPFARYPVALYRRRQLASASSLSNCRLVGKGSIAAVVTRQRANRAPVSTLCSLVDGVYLSEGSSCLLCSLPLCVSLSGHLYTLSSIQLLFPLANRLCTIFRL